MGPLKNEETEAEPLLSYDVPIVKDEELQRRFVPYARWHCIHRFNEICFDEQSDLMDPSGDSGYMYSVVLEKIQEGIRNLVWKIERKIRYGDNFLSDTTNYGLN